MKKLFLLLMLPLMAHAWEPTKPIEAMIGFTPGSGNEIAFRIVTQEIEKNSKVRFIIVNKPGVGSALANEQITKEKPDGYKILIASDTALYATDRMVLPNKTYSTSDYTYVMAFAGTPMTLVANSKDPVNTIQDYIRVTKTEKVTQGDPGSAARLVYEQLHHHIGFTEDSEHLVRVEYKGPADTMNDVIAGHVRFGVMPLLVSNQNHFGGRLAIIATTAATPLSNLPNVPTMSSVYPDFVLMLNYGIVMPKGAPKEVVDWYVKEFNKALASKEVQQKLNDNFIFVNKNLTNPKNYEAFILSQEKKNAKFVDKVLGK